MVGDPVGEGFVASVPRPGGNLTGFMLWEPSLPSKWLQYLIEIARAYFNKLATISAPDKAARYRALLSPVPPASVAQYLAESEPQHNSMLRTSVVPTMLKAGVGVNVIPSEAEATFDVRALSDEDIPRFFEDLKRLIDDPAVRILPITTNLRPAQGCALRRIGTDHACRSVRVACSPGKAESGLLRGPSPSISQGAGIEPSRATNRIAKLISPQST
jgi:hypothetical protein